MKERENVMYCILCCIVYLDSYLIVWGKDTHSKQLYSGLVCTNNWTLYLQHQKMIHLICSCVANRHLYSSKCATHNQSCSHTQTHTQIYCIRHFEVQMEEYWSINEWSLLWVLSLSVNHLSVGTKRAAESDPEGMGEDWSDETWFWVVSDQKKTTYTSGWKEVFVL